MSRFQKGDVVRLKDKSEIVSRKLPQWDDERALRSLERLFGRTATVITSKLPFSSDRLIQASLDNEGGFITAPEDWFDLIYPATKQPRLPQIGEVWKTRRGDLTTPLERSTQEMMDESTYEKNINTLPLSAIINDKRHFWTANGFWYILRSDGVQEMHKYDLMEPVTSVPSSAEKDPPTQLVTLRARAYGIMVDGVMEVETRVETLESGEEIIVVDGPVTRQNHEIVINAIQAMVNDLSAEKKHV